MVSRKATVNSLYETNDKLLEYHLITWPVHWSKDDDYNMSWLQIENTFEHEILAIQT